MKPVCLAGAAAFLMFAGIHASCANEVQHAPDKAHATSALSASSTATRAEMSQGEIKKVDKKRGKLTIKHGELRNLDMPPMTMVFQVKDRAILDQARTGDKISFVAEKIDGVFTVVQIGQTGAAQ